ncbi:transposase InsO family protein [Sinorhizobium terangae]|uniref:DDE-type integrase/transposase/recombinase n=1 Tax=Sinorhizobium terangae TaxID=110322 RepID=A0A6N7LHU0_SINTE|nr:transposase InsO family protein [Sinorhizobium terangae]MQX17362.1 DDE-type integrase/transposase/recombinase [Sinorhizobium terangae]
MVQILERLCRKIGYPKTMRVDQGTEFLSRALDIWAYAKGVVLDFSRPGKPTDNAYIGGITAASGGMPRTALIPDPCGRTAGGEYYSEERPHGAIGN